MRHRRARGCVRARRIAGARRARSLGVTIEAQYTVGEYDILILSAQQSSGLETWLRENGYRIPPGASAVSSSYLRQNMRFFVARVNLTEQAKLGFSYLRPLQVAYESPKFMLPIRLGMVNADGAQELFVYALTRKGRVETTNYRTVKLPSDMELPVYLKEPGEFARFYKAMFSRQVEQGRDARAVSRVRVGHEMVRSVRRRSAVERRTAPARRVLAGRRRRPHRGWRPGRRRPAALDARRGAPDVFLTRLHVRYDNAHFPEDLVFQETADRTNFQGRMSCATPGRASDTCPGAASVSSQRCATGASRRRSAWRR